ncbi:delta-like protein 4 [Liolophura sinensis]|uniref:delta-like protein 4 n=1 Tax=Liolophura sinensis TaxID=3198878 RepID=UPI003158455F
MLSSAPVFYLGFFLFLFHLTKVYGGGTLEIRFIKFENHEGKEGSGACCDGVWFVCPSKCDHKFDICVDKIAFDDDPAMCYYGRKETGVTPDQNNIIFSDNIGGTPNPMIFPFNAWPTQNTVRIKLNVWDIDSLNKHDHVEYFARLVTVPAANEKALAAPTEVVFQSFVSLTTTLKVYCDPYFHSPNCTVYCRARDDEMGHYTCDRDTGTKICMAGWTGRECNEPIQSCKDNPCRNGGACRDDKNGYLCYCNLRYTGRSCEIEYPSCTDRPCPDTGYCFSLVTNAYCACPPGRPAMECGQESGNKAIIG